MVVSNMFLFTPNPGEMIVTSDYLAPYKVGPLKNPAIRVG